MKNILYRFIDGQTNFGMPRGAKTRLALKGGGIGWFFFQIQTLPQRMHHK